MGRVKLCTFLDESGDMGLREELLFWPDRFFRTRVFTVTHRRLLLRSNLDSNFHTRIDVVFGGVDLMMVRPDYHGRQYLFVELHGGGGL